jgi:acetyl-CoA synthetase
MAERINDTGARLVVTADGGYRRGRITPLKEITDAAVSISPGVEKVLVVKRTGQEVPWDKVLSWKPPYARWFNGGRLNASYQCLDRHVHTWRKSKVAIYWEGENGDTRTLSYSNLYTEVNRFASVLLKSGVARGDRVVLYLPMIPELPIFMLACARIGAVHTVIFSGFSPQAMAERINDTGARLVVTADGGYRRGRNRRRRFN